MRNFIRFLFIAALFFKIHNISAQTSGLQLSAYFDGYYAYDFNQPIQNRRHYVTQYDRHNEFNLNHVWIKAAYSSEKIRASLALQTGTYPINNYGAEPSPLYRMIYEGYAGYQLAENSWLDVGVFGGHFGYESALAIDRELLSPALVTEYTPYYQTGVRWTHQLTDKTTLRAVVLNGWQNIAETNNSKSVGMAIDHQLTDALFLSYGNYFGNENTVPAEDKAHRQHHNLVVSYTPAEALSLTAIGDFTTQNDLETDTRSNVSFVTVISSYQLAEQWRCALRYENVQDKDGVLITAIEPFQSNVVSLALSFLPQSNVAIKLEPKFYLDSKRNYPSDGGLSKDAFVLQGGLAIRLE